MGGESQNFGEGHLQEESWESDVSPVVESAECGLSSADSCFSCFVEFEVLLTFTCL